MHLKSWVAQRTIEYCDLKLYHCITPRHEVKLHCNVLLQCYSIDFPLWRHNEKNNAFFNQSLKFNLHNQVGFKTIIVKVCNTSSYFFYIYQIDKHPQLHKGSNKNQDVYLTYVDIATEQCSFQLIIEIIEGCLINLCRHRNIQVFIIS